MVLKCLRLIIQIIQCGCTASHNEQGLPKQRKSVLPWLSIPSAVDYGFNVEFSTQPLFRYATVVRILLNFHQRI
jgi:ABC-type taurine transport system ATPase subunit